MQSCLQQCSPSLPSIHRQVGQTAHLLPPPPAPPPCVRQAAQCSAAGQQRLLAVARSSAAGVAETEAGPQQTMEHMTCPHPDAIKRRQEASNLRRQAETERRKTAMMESMGLKWFEGHQPQNMSNSRSADEYRAIVKQAQEEGKLLVTKFFTEDCYVCKSLYPKMKRIAGDNPDVLWAKLNGSDPSLAPIFQAMGIKKVPYFHMVFNGQLVSEMSVSLSTEKLSKFRAELAAQKQTQARTGPTSTSLQSIDEEEQREQQQQQQQQQLGQAPGSEWA